MGQGKNLRRYKSIFVYFGTDPREKKDLIAEEEITEEYLREDRGQIQSPDGGSGLC